MCRFGFAEDDAPYAVEGGSGACTAGIARVVSLLVAGPKTPGTSDGMYQMAWHGSDETQRGRVAEKRSRQVRALLAGNDAHHAMHTPNLGRPNRPGIIDGSNGDDAYRAVEDGTDMCMAGFADDGVPHDALRGCQGASGMCAAGFC